VRARVRSLALALALALASTAPNTAACAPSELNSRIEADASSSRSTSHDPSRVDFS
jgi:hypothetical protein